LKDLENTSFHVSGSDQKNNANDLTDFFSEIASILESSSEEYDIVKLTSKILEQQK